MEQQDLISLREELRSGTNTRFQKIFEENASYCTNQLLFRHRCSRQDADDLYVEAILIFREKVVLGELTAVRDIKNYLLAICKNMLLTRLKKEQRVKNAIEEIQDECAGSSTESDSIEYRERILKLTELGLSALPEKCRELLKAFYFDKLSLEEIAKKMEFANANVAKATKARCFQKLVEQIRIIEKQDKNINVAK